MSIINNERPILSVVCDEPEGNIVRNVYRFEMTPESLLEFWNKAKQFPTLFGEEIKSDAQKFIDMFFKVSTDGYVSSDSLFFLVDDFVGLFRISEAEENGNANVHYTFFDGRHRGRLGLVRSMIKWVFNEYGFHRLSVEIPNYARPGVRHFVTEIGFVYEGKKRSAALYKGERFDVNLYSLLNDEEGYKKRQHKLIVPTMRSELKKES